VTAGIVNDISIAIAIHVLAVVAMVTTVLLPAVRKFDDAREGLALFQPIEERFAWHARAAMLLAAASGFYMVDRLAYGRIF
jgi:uncharacterized membrane protein